MEIVLKFRKCCICEAVSGNYIYLNNLCDAECIECTVVVYTLQMYCVLSKVFL